MNDCLRWSFDSEGTPCDVSPEVMRANPMLVITADALRHAILAEIKKLDRYDSSLDLIPAGWRATEMDILYSGDVDELADAIIAALTKDNCND